MAVAVTAARKQAVSVLVPEGLLLNKNFLQEKAVEATKQEKERKEEKT
jgi:hypothetical protein